MKSIIACTFLFFSIALQSQDYLPFDFRNGIWVTNYFEHGGTSFDFQYFCDGDTIINQQSFFKLFQFCIKTWYGRDSFLVYYGAIANDTANKKVFLIKNGQLEPEVLYDFNLEIGDTVKEGIGADFNLVVSDVDSVLVCNRFHKRYVIQKYQTWLEDQAFVEGIGFSYGFVEPLVIEPFENTSELVCYTERSNEECEECELLLNRERQTNQKKIWVFPNPVKSWFVFEIIKIEENTFQLDIYDDTGRLIDTHNDIPGGRLEIDVQGYAPGVYIFKLYNTRIKKRYWGKFIVK